MTPLNWTTEIPPGTTTLTLDAIGLRMFENHNADVIEHCINHEYAVRYKDQVIYPITYPKGSLVTNAEGDKFRVYHTGPEGVVLLGLSKPGNVIASISELYAGYK